MIGWRGPHLRPPCPPRSGVLHLLGAMWCWRLLRACPAPAPCGPVRPHSALARMTRILEGELESIRGAGTWKSERIITSPQGPHIHVEGSRGGACWQAVASEMALLGEFPTVARCPGRAAKPDQCEATVQAGWGGIEAL